MIVTFPAAARSRAARRSSRSISPGSCPSHQASVRTVNGARNLGSAQLSFTRRRRDPIDGVVHRGCYARPPCWPRWRHTALLACRGRAELELFELSHDEAAVGAQNLAGHRRRHVGGQVGDGSCGVVRCEPPLERLPVDCFVELLVGVDDAGSRCVG